MTIACMVLATSCEKNDDTLKEGHSAEDQAGMVPEGYFVATFDMGGGTRSLDPTIGPDSRVQHIRYIIFNAADGSFVKERAIWGPSLQILTFRRRLY